MIESSSGKTRALIELMVRQHELGHRTAARKTRNEAIQAGLKGDRASLYRNLAIADAKMDDHCAALEALRRLKEPSERDSTLVAIAKIQAERGETQLAIRTVASIAAPGDREEAMVAIATSRTKRNDINRALQTVAEIKDPVYRTTVLCEVAAAQWRRKDSAGARKTLEKLVEMEASIPIGGGTDTIVCRQIAELSARLGHRDLALKSYERARATAMRYEGLDYQGLLLHDIAESEGKVALRDAAISISTELRAPSLKAWWLLGLAEGIQESLQNP